MKIFFQIEKDKLKHYLNTVSIRKEIKMSKNEFSDLDEEWKSVVSTLSKEDIDETVGKIPGLNPNP